MKRNEGTFGRSRQSLTAEKVAATDESDSEDDGGPTPRKNPTFIASVDFARFLPVSEAKRVMGPEFAEKYPSHFLRFRENHKAKREDVAVKYRERLGPRWTFFPSTPTAFIDDFTGERLRTKQVEATRGQGFPIYIDAFPPGVWERSALFSTIFDVQADDEIASSAVNPNLCVYLHPDYRDFIRNRGVGMDDAIEEFSHMVLRWLRKILFSPPTVVSWSLVDLHTDPSMANLGWEGTFAEKLPATKKNGRAVGVAVTLPRFPREPEYSVFVRNKFSFLDLNAVSSSLKSANSVIEPALYVDSRRMFRTELNDTGWRSALYKICGHILDTMSRGFQILGLYSSVGFDPSRQWLGVKDGNYLFKTSWLKHNAFDEEIYSFFHHGQKPYRDKQVVNMFTYRRWIKEVTHRFGNSKLVLEELPRESSSLLALIALAVFRGGLEVTFSAYGVCFGGNPMCALQQYRVSSRVLFLRKDPETIRSYREHRRERVEVSDFKTRILANAYDIASTADPKKHIGHGVDVNTFSGEYTSRVTDSPNSRIWVAHEASVQYSNRRSGERATDGTWGSRWHAWKSVGQYEGPLEHVIRLRIVLDRWRPDESVDNDGLQFRPTSKPGVQIWREELLPDREFVWNLEVSYADMYGSMRVGERSTRILTFDSDFHPRLLLEKNRQQLAWNYFVTCRPGSGEGTFIYEVFVSDVSVIACADVWSRVWNRAVRTGNVRNVPDGDLLEENREDLIPVVPMVNFAKCPANNATLAHYWNSSMPDSESVFDNHLASMQEHLVRVQQYIDAMRARGPSNPPPAPIETIRRTREERISLESPSNQLVAGPSTTNSPAVHYFTLEELM